MNNQTLSAGGYKVGWINLEGAFNVRDLGALPTEDGRSTAPGRFLRGDNLRDLSPADVRLLVDIGVTTVVDLRTRGERETEEPGPLTRIASIRHEYVSLMPENGEAAGTQAVRRARSLVADESQASDYLDFLDDRPDRAVAALRAIAQSSGAALVHCVLGKDRTGVIVALALTAVGVRREAIVADYAATAERIDAVLARLSTSDDDTTPAEEHVPRAETMTAFLKEIDASYGGVPGWLRDHGFGATDVEAMRAKLLTP